MTTALDLGDAPGPELMPDDTTPRNVKDKVSDARPDGEALPPRGSRSGRPVLPANVEAQLQSYYVMLGMGVNAWEVSISARRGEQRPDHLCGNAIIEQSDACVQAWVKLAETNPKVRKALIRFAESGAFAGILTAHLPILLGLMANHGPAVMQRGFSAMGLGPDSENDE